jgi:hypothetical protein
MDVHPVIPPTKRGKGKQVVGQIIFTDDLAAEVLPEPTTKAPKA